MVQQDPFEPYNSEGKSGVHDNAAPDAPEQPKAASKASPRFANNPSIETVIVTVSGVLVLIGLIATAVLWPRVVPNVPSPERTIAASTVTPTADILSRIDKAFGPWTIVKTGVETYGRVLLVDNSGAIMAGKQFSGDASWQTASTPFITDKTINLSKGTITFRLSTTVTVTVLANQVFILQETPELLYMYRDGGNLVSKPIGV